MIYNYIGEELIWKVRANNPYEKNTATPVNLHFHVETEKEAMDIHDFFLNHIDQDVLDDVERHEYSERLHIKNVFGNISTVNISWI